jgi:hypothetical protein
MKAAKQKANASKSCGPYTSVVTRKDTLERDEYTKDVHAEKVTCKACNKTVKLSTQNTYEIAHWDKHKSKCPRITRKQIVRTAVKKHMVSI